MLHLLGRHIPNTKTDIPAVTKQIAKVARVITVKLILRRHFQRRAHLQRACKHFVAVAYMQVQRDDRGCRGRGLLQAVHGELKSISVAAPKLRSA